MAIGIQWSMLFQWPIEMQWESIGQIELQSIHQKSLIRGVSDQISLKRHLSATRPHRLPVAPPILGGVIVGFNFSVVP